MHLKSKLGLLAVIALGLTAVFLFMNLGPNIGYALPRRAVKIGAIILTGVAIAFSTIVFQTITNNRILTPSILGLDWLYMLVQSFVVFAFGSGSVLLTSKNLNFAVSAGLMVLFSHLLFRVLFRGQGRNIYFLLLIGMVFGVLFQSFSTFMQVLTDPNEFLVVQGRLFASFNHINTDLLLITAAGMALVTIYFWRYAKYLDVIALGRDQAVNLGVDYDAVVKRLLIVVAVLVSLSTALVGPITFLGLLVANLAHEFLKTYRHRYLIGGSMLISVIALVGGQLVVERVFTFSTTVTVIINLVGGAYFLYLLLKENKSW